MRPWSTDSARLLEAAAEAREREDERDKRLERVESLLRSLLTQRVVPDDPDRLSSAIIGRLLRDWHDSRFKDLANYLTTQGRKIVSDAVLDFFTYPR